MANGKVLYLGDTGAKQAAAYLSGVMHHAGIAFDYFPSDFKMTDDVLARDYAAIILSDYAADNFTDAQAKKIVERVRSGMGLLMLGGWESYKGTGGNYDQSPIADVLPVIVSDKDDRVNSFCPYYVEIVAEHDILDGLPFEASPPAVGGFNRFEAKDNDEVAILLVSRRLFCALLEEGYQFDLAEEVDPMLVVAEGDGGRVACFASDVAPHWIGGMVDWGNERVRAQADGAGEVEVGNWYAEFFAKLVKWTAQL